MTTTNRKNRQLTLIAVDLETNQSGLNLELKLAREIQNVGTVYDLVALQQKENESLKSFLNDSSKHIYKDAVERWNVESEKLDQFGIKPSWTSFLLTKGKIKEVFTKILNEKTGNKVMIDLVYDFENRSFDLVFDDAWLIGFDSTDLDKFKNSLPNGFDLYGGKENFEIMAQLLFDSKDVKIKTVIGFAKDDFEVEVSVPL